MNDKFELINVELDEFKKNIKEDVDEDNFEEERCGILKPESINYQDAVREGKAMLEDFPENQEIKMVIFEYKDGYQVDVVDGPEEYEIYNDLYGREDVISFVSWNSNKKEVIKVK